MLACVSACGLPRPFAGDGLSALTRPPPARLSIPAPAGALLSDQARHVLADDLAAALAAKEVPAVAEETRRGDWRLVVTAELRGDHVVPVFEIEDEKGEKQGIAEGAPVPTDAWSEAAAPTLTAVATNAAGNLTSLLGRIDAARRQSDPNDLINRPARVVVTGVTGAPGDGDRALARQMTEILPQLGETVQDSARDADYSVAGQVATAPGAGNTTRVEIQWIVSDAKGAERGRIVQLNEVVPGSLDGRWGDVAHAVAAEAAGGVRDVILNQAGGRASR